MRTKKFLACIAVGMMSFGCERLLQKTDQPGNTHMQVQQQEEFQEGTEVIFILKNLHLIKDEQQTPTTFYVKGIIEHGGFVPQSNVLGIGELGNDGRYGWLELGSKQFYPMESDRKAITPFVKGYMTNQGFTPSVREVFLEP